MNKQQKKSNEKGLNDTMFFKYYLIILEEIGMKFPVIPKYIVEFSVYAVHAPSAKIYSVIKIYQFCLFICQSILCFFSLIYSFLSEIQSNILFSSRNSFDFLDLTIYVI